MTEVAGKPGPEAEVAKPANLEPTAQEKFARLQGGAIIGIKTAKHFLQNDGAPDFPSRSRQLNQAKVELEEAKPIIDQLGVQVSIINYKWFEELTNGLGDQKGTFIDRVRQIDTAYQASDKLEQIVTNAREDLRRMSGSRQSRIIHYRQIRDTRRQLKQLEVYSEAYGKRVKPYQDKLDSIKTNAILVETARKEALKTYSQRVLSSTEERIGQVREASVRLLTDPQWVDQANEALISELVEPSLARFVADDMFDIGVADEIREYVRTHLREGFRYVYKTGYVDPNSSPEQAALIKKKFAQHEDLSQRSKFRLDDILRRVNLDGDSRPSDLYRRVGDVVTNLALYQSLNSLKDIQDELDPDTRIQLDVLLKPFVQAINVHDLFRTEGLSRWRTVAERLVGNGVLSNTDVAAAEDFFIQEAGKVLHYGGHESWDGTHASWAMSEIGSARVLPTLFSHIRMFGSGHTTVSVLGNLKSLYRVSTPEQIEAAMVKMSPEDKRVVRILGDPDSFIHQLDSYVACELIKRSGSQVAAKEQIIKLVLGTGLQRGELHNFYFAEFDNDPEVRKIWEMLLKEHRGEAEHVIIESKTSSWARAADKFLAALVNPKNGDPIAFPRRIMTEGLGVTDQKMLDILNSIFGQKTFNKSGFQRESFLDGLLILNSRTDGAQVLDKLFDAYRGSRSDPERITRIFRMMEAMNNLGESEFAVPDSSEAETLLSEIESLDELSKAATTREQRKEYQAQAERLKVKLNDLTGLKGIEDAMTEKFVEIACKKLELPDEYRVIVQQNLEGLLRSGLLDIVPSLAGAYEMKGEHDVKGLLRVLTMHVIAGDFLVWRYSHEQSEAQLAGLSAEQREVWIRNFGPVKIEAAVGEGNNAGDTLRTIQQIVSDAREHITQTAPDFEISQINLDRLNSTIASLTEKIKSSQSREDLIEASTEKGKLEDQVLMMRVILELESLGLEDVAREKIFSLAERGSKALAKLNMPLAQLDIEQLGKVFSAQTGSSIIAVESDDPIVLLNVGVAPRETCQSWRGGGYNECLLSYVVDSNKKVINLTDEAGNIIGRSVIKLTDEKGLGEPDEKKSKTILVEPIYLISASDEAYRAFARILLEKANAMGVTVTLAKGFDEKALAIFGEEAEKVDYSPPGGLVEMREVYLPQSLNRHEYSDDLGGKISWFNNYVQTDAKVLRKIPS